MRYWKEAVVAVLIGAGAVWVGCGGEAPEASVGDGPASGVTDNVQLATAAFSVEGMTCGGCAIATEMSVRKLDGVSSVEASYDEDADEGRATVEYDPARVETDAIAGAIRDAGFEPTLQRTGESG